MNFLVRAFLLNCLLLGGTPQGLAPVQVFPQTPFPYPEEVAVSLRVGLCIVRVCELFWVCGKVFGVSIK